MISVAIDGPSGAGKSTIARAVAKTLGFIYIDTGAMYRAVGLAARRKGIDTSKDTLGVISVLEDLDIDIQYINGEQHVFLDGEDVSADIRTPEISLAASHVAVIKEVRLKMVDFQRFLAGKRDCIMDGRDIGTFVLPHANVKIFLTAAVEARAKRRFEELLAKGQQVTYEEVLSDMEFRDNNDSSREFMPLKKAEDAHLIDTTNLTLEESIAAVEDYICRHI